MEPERASRCHRFERQTGQRGRPIVVLSVSGVDVRGCGAAQAEGDGVEVERGGRIGRGRSRDPRTAIPAEGKDW